MISQIVKAGIGALVMTTALSSPASALFGPTCIPTLYNCYCTHIKPCPVNDAAKNAKLAIENSKLKEALQLMKDLKDPKSFLIKTISGENSFGIPGLDSIGIDLSKIAAGDFSGLGLPPGITQLADNLSSVGIDLDMVVAMANGELEPAHFLQVAEAAGVDFSQLDAAGLGRDTILQLASGDITPEAILGVATNMGLQGNVFANLGISEQLLADVAAGKADPQKILNIAQNAGLDMSALESAGLTTQAISQIASGASPEALMGMLQSAGYDQSPITALGIDASTLGGIASGKLPPEAINNLMAGTGIDPKAISIPGASGPISLGGGAGTRPTSREDMVSIPIDSVPGLRNAIDTARGIPSSGASNGNSASSAALCAAPKSLISVGMAPNDFGDDVATIDAALSPGDIIMHEEVIADAEDIAAEVYSFGQARAIQMRPLLKASLEAVDNFDEMMRESKAIEDDRAINDTIQTQVMVAKAEVASLMTALLSVKASKQINRDFVTVVPLLPHDSQWQASIEARITQPAERRMEVARETTTASQDYSALRRDAVEIVHHHNLLVDAAEIEASLPALIDTINFHEEHKTFLVQLESIIKDRLDDLYVGGAEASWPSLRATLNSSYGSYVSPSKWDQGFATARSLSAGVTAQAPRTAYGTRILLSPATREMPATFSTTSETPYSYQAANQLSRGYDPYRVKPRSSLIIQDREGGGMPLGMELVGVFQSYLETLRRLDFYGQIRRGDASVSMTSDFWNEMALATTDCLSGPIPTNPENLAARPDLFDLSPYCTHIMWTGGDEGDYIDPSEISGTDAALWMSKISIDRVQRRTGGEAAVRARAAETLEAARASQLSARVGSTLDPSISDQVQALREALGTVAQGTTLQDKIRLQ